MPAPPDVVASTGVSSEWQTVHVHPAAPPKPAWGEPCNGCGVCCLVEPCPVGMVYSRRRSGACAALRWDEAQALYRCGLASDPLPLLGWPRAPRGLSAWLGRRMRRWIAAGQGCDASFHFEAVDFSVNSVEHVDRSDSCGRALP